MRIGIHATYAALKNKTGVGYYTYHLIHHLALLDRENEYFLFYNKKTIGPQSFLRIKNKNFHQLLFYPRLFFFNPWKLDIFHEPAFRFLKPVKARSVVTIHDITSVFPDSFMSEKFRKKANRKLHKSIYNSDRIIAVSHNTKKDIINHFPVPPDKINVVYHGIGEEYRIESGKKARAYLHKRYGLKGDFLLFVGSIETRKNIANMIMAYLNAKINKKIKLVLVGGKGYGWEFLSQLIGNVKEDVIHFPYIPGNELVWFYNSAEALVFPSFYEGFGLPVLEAMACGIPVITSNNSSLAEIGKGHVLYVNPFQIDSIARGMETIVKDKKYVSRLTSGARQYSNHFSWLKCAERTRKVYFDLYQSK
ncbi:MAG: glycosyltransferase family 4 protein [Spirochaetes bacterium]|nr:glycosyltransferase family 4 protein [Spirochaetota bacterium]